MKKAGSPVPPAVKYEEAFSSLGGTKKNAAKPTMLVGRKQDITKSKRRIRPAMIQTTKTTAWPTKGNLADLLSESAAFPPPSSSSSSLAFRVFTSTAAIHSGPLMLTPKKTATSNLVTPTKTSANHI